MYGPCEMAVHGDTEIAEVLHLLYLFVVDLDRKVVVFFPEVDDQLFGFLYVQLEVVLSAPFREMFDFGDVVGFVGLGDESCNCCVICIFQDKTVVVLAGEVIGVDVVAEWRKDTALGSARAGGQGAG